MVICCGLFLVKNVCIRSLLQQKRPLNALNVNVSVNSGFKLWLLRFLTQLKYREMHFNVASAAQNT